MGWIFMTKPRLAWTLLPADPYSKWDRTPAQELFWEQMLAKNDNYCLILKGNFYSAKLNRNLEIGEIWKLYHHTLWYVSKNQLFNFISFTVYEQFQAKNDRKALLVHSVTYKKSNWFYWVRLDLVQVKMIVK